MIHREPSGATAERPDESVAPVTTAGAGPVAPKPAVVDAAGEADASLDPALLAHIGRELRGLYDEIVEQPVPDRFLRLLEELDRAKGKPE